MDEMDELVESYLSTVAIYNCHERNSITAFLQVWQTIETLLFSSARDLSLEYYRVNFYSGSRWSGLPEESCGDVDTMFNLENWPEVLFHRPNAEIIYERGYLIAEPMTGMPAYLKMKALGNTVFKQSHPRSSKPVEVEQFLEKEENGWRYANGSKFVYLNSRQGDEIHGPSAQRDIEPDVHPEAFDNVPCLVCRQWPQVAAEFISRIRPSTIQTIIDDITTNGCHIVARGSQGSELEWCLAFSIPEKELLFRMSDASFACLYVLKMIKNKFWADDQNPKTGKIFSSYHLKTAVFWIHEQYHDKDLSVTQLCKLTLKWLIDCYRSENLPHYFIPEQNLLLNQMKRSEEFPVVIDWLDQINKFLVDKIISAISISNEIRETIEGKTSDIDCSAKIQFQQGIQDFKKGGALFKRKERLAFVRNFRQNYPPINSSLKQLFTDLYCKLPCNAGLDTSRLIGNNRNEKIDELIKNIEENMSEEELESAFDASGISIKSMLPSADFMIDDFVEKLKNICIPRNIKDFVEMMIDRLIGDIFHELMLKLPRNLPNVRNKTSEIAARYYKKGMEANFYDGWSDRGLGGLVLLARHYYFAEEWDMLKEIISELQDQLHRAETDAGIKEGLFCITIKQESPMFEDIKLYKLTDMREVARWDYTCFLSDPITVGNYIINKVGTMTNTSVILH